MLQHVVERCCRARGVETVLVCTDSPEVQAAAAAWGVQALLTPASCRSGSERLATVLPALLEAGGRDAGHTLVINVQGDQPLLDPAVIEAMVERFAALGRPAVLTPVYPLGQDKLHDPNVVKVLRAHDGRAITFSRSALPHVRDLAPELWATRTTYWGHVGLYGYRGDVLASWNALPHSPLEDLEKLEQLRLIDAGVPITTFVVEQDCFSVDTPEQLEQARHWLAATAG